jgi:hypothetical protein
MSKGVLPRRDNVERLLDLLFKRGDRVLVSELARLLGLTAGSKLLEDVLIAAERSGEVKPTLIKLKTGVSQGGRFYPHTAWAYRMTTEGWLKRARKEQDAAQGGVGGESHRESPQAAV